MGFVLLSALVFVCLMIRESPLPNRARRDFAGQQYLTDCNKLCWQKYGTAGMWVDTSSGECVCK